MGGGSIPTQCIASILTLGLIKETSTKTQGGPTVYINLQPWVMVLTVKVINDSITEVAANGSEWF